MRKRLFLGWVVMCLALGVSAQEGLVKLKIQAVLVDEDLNLKPVPKLALTLRRIEDMGQGEPLQLSTGFDGLTEIDLSPGRYQLSTPRAVKFQGSRYTWELELSLLGAETKIELSNNNATVTEITPKQAPRVMDDLRDQFKYFQNSVVTVWSEIGHGTGFLVDPQGLILTNQHVIGPSEYIAIQFDADRKLPAVLLAADSQRDVAVLWADISRLPEMVVAPIAQAEDGNPPVVEGERVFTIGSPLDQRKILTSGFVSKVEERAILSDININPGNSGGPLFSTAGFVVGLTTFGQQAHIGPGISGIVRIEEALPLLTEAKEKMAEKEAPSSMLLPVEPKFKFPVEAIKAILEEGNFQLKPYFFWQGDYEVAIITPPLLYYVQNRGLVKAAERKEKRAKKSQKKKKIRK